MIRFSASGCAIIQVDKYMSRREMLGYVAMFKNERKQKKNVEFVIDVGYPIVEVSDEKVWLNGGKAREYEIVDVKWHHINNVIEHAFVTIKQGSWYFSIARNNMGFWYSGDMLKLGWWHGGAVEEIDHSKYTLTRRDYA